MNGSEIAFTLGSPVVGAILLAFYGDRAQASRLNVLVSLVTFIASALLAMRVGREGALLAYNEAFFVDSFNVFLVVLTAFVAFTTSIFSRPYMLNEQEHGRITAGRLRLYHCMYQVFVFTMLLVLLTNNMGILWVALEADSRHRAAGEPVPHPGQYRGGMEIFYSVQCGHRASAVRYDTAVSCRRKSAGRRRQRAAMDAFESGEG